MPEIAARLRADQVGARKASDKDRTLVLGTVFSSFKNREIELGRVMAALMGRFKGKADGKVINQIAREALQQG